MANSTEKQKEIWTAIVYVHNRTKGLVLLAEEIDPEHGFFWPPLIQQRDALDHIVRAQRVILSPEEQKKIKDPDDYAGRQLDKSLGHIYRAFFDVADWFSIMLRERICDLLQAYSRETLLKGVLDFGPTEKRLDEIPRQIADLRKDKDVLGASLSVDVDKYVAIIDELESVWQRLALLRPQLDEAEQSSSNNTRGAVV